MLCIGDTSSDWESLAGQFEAQNWRSSFIKIDAIFHQIGNQPDTYENKFDGILVDDRLVVCGRLSGIALIRGLYHDTPVIAVGRFCGPTNITAAVACGADMLIGYYPTTEEIAHLHQLLCAGNKRPTDTSSGILFYEGLLTQDTSIIATVEAARALRGINASVLINGPTGAGKEMLAGIVHGTSSAERPFVDINCAALPRDLLESELFGYKKGGFSGAMSDSIGLIRSANGGTLFLDEIGELPLNVQVKLLHALETGEVRPVGSDSSFQCHFRIISATHRDLTRAVAQGLFNLDLLLQISTRVLYVSAIEDRRRDVPLLAQYFLQCMFMEKTSKASTFSRQALLLLMNASWHGNVRQIKSLVKLCAVICNSPVVSEVVVAKILMGSVSSAIPDVDQMIFESDQLSLALALSGGAVSAASRMLDKNRTELYRLIKSRPVIPLLQNSQSRRKSDNPALGKSLS